MDLKEEARERLSFMRTPLVETLRRTLLMEIFLEELESLTLSENIMYEKNVK